MIGIDAPADTGRSVALEQLLGDLEVVVQLPVERARQLCRKKANTPPAYRPSTTARVPTYHKVKRTRTLRGRHRPVMALPGAR